MHLVVSVFPPVDAMCTSISEAPRSLLRAAQISTARQSIGHASERDSSLDETSHTTECQEMSVSPLLVYNSG